MPYSGGRVTDFFGPRAFAVTGRSAKRMADRGGERMHELTVINTPIGGRYRFPDAEVANAGGGNLRSSWYQLPVTRTRTALGRGFQSGVATDVDYAPHVEYGTGLWGPRGAKYEIRPRTPGGWLHWRNPNTGADVFAKRVMHPGSPGAHMVMTAATLVKHEVEHGLFADILDGWARAVEASVR